MARWEPDARGRLQRAAMDLFRERGYTDVTVAEIAERAGLTKRTFFNHFADKREVFFANAQWFEESALAHIAAAEPGPEAIDVAVHALTLCGLELATMVSAEDAKTRFGLLVTTPELRERDLIKTAQLTTAMAALLVRRGATERAASFAAQAAVAVFGVAAAEWVSGGSADFPGLMRRTLSDLRTAVA